ncbi:MAG: putative Fe-S cluster assembly protein SufT [Thermoanaerobaculia bacterium]|nr:putative Fe-S cluster assembly protein SufT [Thermoanaerobaculia bacterium]
MEATAIPSGEPVRIPEGTGATITQALGGSFTLITDMGWMVRVSGREVEAIGKEPPEEIEIEADASKEDLEQLIWEQMKTCYDPEIPVNIVDLGLVYMCELDKVEDEEDGKFDVRVKMTLTAPGCGMGPVLADDVRQKIEALGPIRKAHVEIVFDPMWDRSMMSEAAKLQLGMY